MASQISKWLAKTRTQPKPKSELAKLKQKLTAANKELAQTKTQLKTAQAQLTQLATRQSEYSQATFEAHQEVEAARAQRAQLENVLQQIMAIIEFGDRGAVTALGQIRQLIEDN